jgi:hypothetical protein
MIDGLGGIEKMEALGLFAMNLVEGGTHLAMEEKFFFFDTVTGTGRGKAAEALFGIEVEVEGQMRFETLRDLGA